MLTRFKAFYKYSILGHGDRYLVADIVVVGSGDDAHTAAVQYFRKNFTTDAMLVRLEFVSSAHAMSLGIAKGVTKTVANPTPPEFYGTRGEA